MSEHASQSELLTQAQTQLLFQDDQWAVDEELTAQLATRYGDITSTVYRHIYGRIFHLFLNEGVGRLYPSMEAFQAKLDQLKGKSNQHGQPLRMTHHVLEGRLPQGRYFPEHVRELVQALPAALNLSVDLFDYSVNSLGSVDEAIHVIGRDKCVELPIFPMLVAYVGEVMRHDTNGRWEMRVSKYHSNIWEPWIVDPEGRYVNPFLGVYDELDEQEICSLRGSTAIRLNFRAPLPDNDGAGDPIVLYFTPKAADELSSPSDDNGQ